MNNIIQYGQHSSNAIRMGNHCMHEWFLLQFLPVTNFLLHKNKLNVQILAI